VGRGPPAAALRQARHRTPASETLTFGSDDMEDQHKESKLTVLLALAANLGIAIAKIVAAIVTGSASLPAEAAHPVADTFNELRLLAALRRSGRPADRRHPLGHGKERYFWSLLVA